MFGHILKVKSKKRDQDTRSTQTCTFPQQICPHSSLKVLVSGGMFLMPTVKEETIIYKRLSFDFHVLTAKSNFHSTSGDLR